MAMTVMMAGWMAAADRHNNDADDGPRGCEIYTNTPAGPPRIFKLVAHAPSPSNVPFINFAHIIYGYTETLAKNGIITPISTENMLKNVAKLTFVVSFTFPASILLVFLYYR